MCRISVVVCRLMKPPRAGGDFTHVKKQKAIIYLTKIEVKIYFHVTPQHFNVTPSLHRFFKTMASRDNGRNLRLRRRYLNQWLLYVRHILQVYLSYTFKGLAKRCQE
jgi:hypothetical protein